MTDNKEETVDFDGLEPIEVVDDSAPTTKNKRSFNVNDEYDGGEVALARRLPPLPGKSPTFEQLLDYMHSLTPEQWDHIMIYLYRVHPAIIREKGRTSIDIYSEPVDFTRPAIVEKHGGGKYKVMVKDTEAGFQGKGKILMTTYFTIPLSEADPILNYDELDFGDFNNRSYVDNLVNRGIIDREGRVMEKKSESGELTNLVRDLVEQISRMSSQQIEQLNRQRSSNDPENVAVTKAMDIIAKAGDKSNEMLMDRVKNEDPSKMLTIISTIADKLAPKGSGGDTEMIRMLMTMQADSHKTQMELMGKLVEVQTKTSDSEDKMLDKLVKYKEIFGMLGSGGGKRNWYDAVVDNLPQILNPIANTVANVVRLQALKKGVALPQEGVSGVPVEANTGNEMINPNMMQNQEGANTMNAGEQPQQQQINPVDFVNNYGGMVLQALNAGTPGDVFADNIVSLFGMGLHGTIANIGKENILEAMKSVPEFYSQVQFIWPQVEEFVDRFIKYPEIIKSEEEQENVVNGEVVEEVKEEKKS